MEKLSFSCRRRRRCRCLVHDLILSYRHCSDLRWRLHQQNELKKQEALHLRLSLHQLIIALTMPHADSALVPEQYVVPLPIAVDVLPF